MVVQRYDVRVSLVEIYMEKVHDLLLPMDACGSSAAPNLRVCQYLNTFTTVHTKVLSW